MENIKLIRLIPNRDESSFKLLGVLIDCHLNMKDQCKSVESKISKAIFAINQKKNFLDPPYLKLMANAYIGSHLEYCSSLFTMCNKTTIKPLELSLKKTVRLVSGVGRREHTAPLFKELNILPVRELIEFNVCESYILDLIRSACRLRPECADYTILGWLLYVLIYGLFMIRDKKGFDPSVRSYFLDGSEVVHLLQLVLRDSQRGSWRSGRGRLIQ